MWTLVNRHSLAVIAILVGGCAMMPDSLERASEEYTAPAVVQAGYREMMFVKDDEPAAPASVVERIDTSEDLETQTLGLADLIDLTVERNPRLLEVSWAIERARGRALQAGLYPNPVFSVTGNELGDRTGASGIWSVYNEQEIVTAHKLGLNRAAVCKEVDQATLALVATRYEIFTDIRKAYFEAVTLQKRAEILAELVALAEQSVENANKLRRAMEAAELDVVQLEVDLERYRADLAATQRALPGVYRKVAASVGIEDMPIVGLAGSLDQAVPDYDLDQVRSYVLGIHPELQSAQVGVDRARLVLRRAEVEPIPNVSVGAGYTHQGQNRSNDWDFGVRIPIPAWNQNQGKIREARAQVREAAQQVERVKNELVEQLATVFSDFAAAKERSERYTTAILPRAQRTYELSRKAYQGGQFEYLRVLQAQRTVAEANLELLKSQGEMWRAGSEIAGLMLEDQWPAAATRLAAKEEQP